MTLSNEVCGCNDGACETCFPENIALNDARLAEEKNTERVFGAIKAGIEQAKEATSGGIFDPVMVELIGQVAAAHALKVYIDSKD